MPEMQNIKVKREERGMRLGSFIASHFALSGRKAKQLLDARRIFVNGKRVWMARHPLAAGDTVSVPVSPNRPGGEVEAPITVLHEDPHLLVINKPAGRVSNRSPESVEALLQQQLEEPSLKAAHRLDRDTSGCLIIARTPACFESVVKLFKARQVQKTYLALVAGRASFKEKVLSYPLDGREAVSRVAVLQTGCTGSLLEIHPETGRKHQIRRHLSRIGHPVLGDKIYQTAHQPEALQAIPRQMLHAFKLAFPHPLSGRPMACGAEIPDDFTFWIDQMRLSGK